LDNAGGVRGLDAAEEGCVEVIGVGRVAVAVGLDAGVDALGDVSSCSYVEERGQTDGGVTVPDVHVDVREGVAGIGVDQLDVHVKGDTFLVLENVLADQFTGDVCID
jgi:hypothetical protein